MNLGSKYGSFKGDIQCFTADFADAEHTSVVTPLPALHGSLYRDWLHVICITSEDSSDFPTIEMTYKGPGRKIQYHPFTIVSVADISGA